MIYKELKNEVLFFLTLLLIFTFIAFAFSLKLSKHSEVEIDVNTNLDRPIDAINSLCDGLDYEILSKKSNLDIQNIEITIPNSNNWYENLVAAYLDGGEYPGFIKEQYKEYFLANLTIFYNDDLSCEFEIEARISGDWKDHIDSKNFLSSLDINMLEGNIFGITKFKLFLPDTRRGDNEIIITSFLKQFDFPVPRTFYVNLKINDTDATQFIFQEKITKEFLEFNKMREGPIIETNEKYFWETSTNQPFKEDTWRILTLGKIRNLNWSKRTPENELNSLNALWKYNYALNTNKVDGFLHSDLDETLRISLFDALVTGLQGHHMLTNHNRIFYFDSINQNFIPIYYDGGSSFLDKEDIRIKLWYYDQPALMFGVLDAINLLESNPIDPQKLIYDVKLSGLDIDIDTANLLIEKLNSNLKLLLTKEISLDRDYPNSSEVIEALKNNNIRYSYDDNWKYEENSGLINSASRNINLLLIDKNNVIYVCSQILTNCEESLSIKDARNIFQKKLSDDEEIYGLINLEKNTNNFKISKFEDFKIKIFNDAKVIVDLNKNEIQINLDKTNQKVLFLEDSNLNNFKIVITNNVDNQLKFRSDRNLLTGCVTFYKSKFIDTSIISRGSHCEDSINIINSEGQIRYIEITNASQDGLDIDFSNLTVDNVYVQNAGNDCIDFSGSNITLFAIEVQSCGDKAISVGEMTSLKIIETVINQSNSGIAVKDSSSVEVNKAIIDDTNYCYLIYRKKQEFGPSKLLISESKCESSSFFIEEGSYIDVGK